jgi:hypothetical protein
MTLQNDLLAMERKFWSGDAGFYRQNLDDECLTVFTKMAGVQKKEAIAEMIDGDSQRWQDVTLDQKGLLEPTKDTAILSYEAQARRANGERYHALVSSGYVRRNGAWKLAFHQQTPLPN